MVAKTELRSLISIIFATATLVKEYEYILLDFIQVISANPWHASISDKKQFITQKYHEDR